VANHLNELFVLKATGELRALVRKADLNEAAGAADTALAWSSQRDAVARVPA
jgi:hypothetical protein